LTRGCAAIVLEIPAFPFQEPWICHRNPLKNILALPHVLTRLWHYFLLQAFLARTLLPLVIFDFQDSCAIAARFLPLLRRALRYHKRELPRLPVNAFLQSEPFAIEPWRNRGRYAAEVAKLRPLSMGALCSFPAPRPDGEKTIDVLWGGTIDNSPVRQRGVELLRELKAEGYHITLLEEPVSKDAFWDLVARSWLTFCPDGLGWQCYRAFEAGSLGSIPLLSYPSIWQDEPFRHGEHCFYYNPEGDDLKKVIRAALADRQRLAAMSAQVRQFVAHAHTEAAVYGRHLGRDAEFPSALSGHDAIFLP
jgi:hypothetical protein